MQKAIKLGLYRVDDRFAAMADIEAANAAGEVQVAVAVDVFDPRVFGLGHVDRCADRKPARYGVRATLGESLRLWAWNRSFQLNSCHVNSQFSSSLVVGLTAVGRTNERND